MVVGRGHFAVPDGGRGQGADCRVLAVATRVLGRGGFCRQQMNGGDGGESNPKTLRRGVGAVGSSRPYPSSMPSLSYLNPSCHSLSLKVVYYQILDHKNPQNFIL
jgi:hypothetical protein